MTNGYDSIVVGGGHNGLVCAAYLARDGQRVLVVEAASEVGGAAVTGTITEGYKVSSCAHILHLLHPKVAIDLKLESHGLRFSSRDMPTVGLMEEGRHVVLSADADKTADSLLAHSRVDARALLSFKARLSRFARVLRPLLGEVPPRLGTTDWSNRLALMKLGWSIRKLGRDDMREFLRVAGSNVADVLEETFESDALKGVLAFDAVLGTRLGPRSPNTMLTLLYRLAGESTGTANAIGHGLSHPEGGMGSVTLSLASATKAAGVEIRTEAPVARVLIEADRAVGVELETGEQMRARAVVSNADPRRSFLSLVGSKHLDTGFVRRVQNIRMLGTAAKLNLALDGLPSFTGLDRDLLGSRLVIAPSLDYVEQAFNHAKYGEYSEHPAIELILPSVHDAGLAPEGKHVLSATVQYAPYDLQAGWDKARETFADRVIDVLEVYAPDIKEKLVARQLITPMDLERDFRITGGHWHHGELTFDQFLMLRPVPGAAQYATPVPGFYLCGSGTHPGGGVMGAAGMNAARQILATEGRS